MALPGDTRILVIDDYRYMARTVRALLAHAGFGNVAEAADGSEALTLLRTGTFHVAVCDLVLNCPDGLDVLRSVRRETALRDLPFLFYTIDRSERAVSAMRAAGASGWLFKPFGAKALQSAIASAMAGTSVGSEHGRGCARSCPSDASGAARGASGLGVPTGKDRCPEAMGPRLTCAPKDRALNPDSV